MGEGPGESEVRGLRVTVPRVLVWLATAGVAAFLFVSGVLGIVAKG